MRITQGKACKAMSSVICHIVSVQKKKSGSPCQSSARMHSVPRLLEVQDGGMAVPGSRATDKDQLPPSRTSHDHILVRATRLSVTTSCLLDTEMTKHGNCHLLGSYRYQALC